MLYIYILKLVKGKFYVGKTRNPEIRLKKHFESYGSLWTKIYKPIKVIKIIKDCDDYDEDKYTKMYMDKYGINNVRGGSFASPKLDSMTIEFLKRCSNSANDRCFKCGEKGHFAKNCKK